MRTRLLGFLLIVVGLVAGSWLYRAVHGLPYGEEGVEHLAMALLAFLSLSIGGTLLIFGSALFEVPEIRHD